MPDRCPADPACFSPRWRLPTCSSQCSRLACARPVSKSPEARAIAGIALAPFVALAGLVLSAVSRHAFLTIVAVLALTATAAIQIPRYCFARPGATQFADIQVLTSNLRNGEADPSSFVVLAENDADVTTVSELTPEVAQGFSRAGLDEAFPYSVLIPAPDAGGIGLWSRYPLDAMSPGTHRNFGIDGAHRNRRLGPTCALRRASHVMSGVLLCHERRRELEV